MKKLFLFLLLLILVFVCAAVFILGYLGAIPGLAEVLGANKPRDLGVRYTRAEYDSYVRRATSEIVELPEADDPGKGILFTGQRPLKETFTQEEMSARLNYATWRYLPVSNSQIRIQDDGALEFSGNLRLDRLEGFILAIGGGDYAGFGLELSAPLARIVGSNPAVYIRAKASVTNNKSDISVEKIQLGRFGLPLDSVGDTNELVEALTDYLIGRVSGFGAKSVIFREGKMFFEGTVPEKILVRPAE